MLEVIAVTPTIGHWAENVSLPSVRHIRLKRTSYQIYYRVIDSPPRLQVLAFWHSRRGKGPPI
jgi:hypothetical protein